ncbi:MAG: PilC/PilY family type IV pilus protein [Hydrogenophilus sp.]|nr:PilC/PilY family type IV pilus protein [Hydrogenophilus sp.]
MSFSLLLPLSSPPLSSFLSPPSFRIGALSLKRPPYALPLSLLLSLLFPLAAVAATIPKVPLIVGQPAFANVMINLSVETPMGGAAYADQRDNPPGCSGRTTVGGREVGTCFIPTYRYLGLFDPDKCYTYDTGNGRFLPAAAASGANRTCGSGQWSGNFLNWATMTAADIFIWAMTGGNRIVDTTAQTILERARAIDNSSWFPVKYLANPSGYAPFSTSIYIANHLDGGYRFRVGTAFGGNDLGTFNVQLRVCDPSTGLEKNCQAHTTSSGTTLYKPVGLIQRYSDKMRFGLFAYTNDNAQSRDGGVLRAPLHYVGAQRLNAQGVLENNPEREFDPATGQLIANPLGAAGGKSGVINYLNQFHKDGYKSYDPIGELFYEVIRYFKRLPPTPEYAAGAPAGSFPIYTTWNDPQEFWCQKNFVVAINDANPWLDKKLPGTYFTCDKANSAGLPTTFLASDCGEPSNPDATINVSALTQQVGALEGLHTTWTQNPTTGEDTVGYVAGVTNNVGACSGSKTVTNLAQVMGTCPYPGKENSYYIAGLAYYANTTDLRSDHPGEQKLTSFFIDTQEYSTNPLSGNRNMLWLAAKYGGFLDIDGNDQPNLPTEWDSDNDGIPDHYVLATQPEQLVNGLERAFLTVLERLGAATSVAVTSTELKSDTRIFQATFNSALWSGELNALALGPDGPAEIPIWRASQQLPSPAVRRLYTRSGGQTVELLWNNLSEADRTALQSAEIIDYLRGSRAREMPAGPYRRRALTSLLGDIVHSTPAYLKTNETVLVGSNDGMLHAFDALTGRERFAYIPSLVLDRLRAYALPTYTHDYFVDGEIAIGENLPSPYPRHIAVATLGRGGKGLFALNLTDPDNFNAGHLLWECFVADGSSGSGKGGSSKGSSDIGTVAGCRNDSDMGHILTRPLIVPLNSGHWAVITGNGYNSASGKAVLFIHNLLDGSLLAKIDTGVAGDNGLGGVAAYDADFDGIVDYLYAGDLKGNLWRFDLTAAQPNQWDVAFRQGNTRKPLFTARDAAGNPQPITAPPTVTVCDRDRTIIVGTGSYFRALDPADTQTQTLYGLFDRNSEITHRNSLTARTILSEGLLDNRPVRTLSAAAAGDLSGKEGWFLDFSSQPGERIVSAAARDARSGTQILFFSTIRPRTNPCIPGGDGYLMAVAACSGAQLPEPIFDLDRDNNPHNDRFGGLPISGVQLPLGMPSAPTVVSDQLVVGGTTGEVSALKLHGTSERQERTQRRGWLEIIE